LIKASEARKASYFCASFLTSFLFCIISTVSRSILINTHLVELLQILNGHEGELLVELLCSVDIHSVGENAERHSGSGNMGQSDGSRESLVPLGVVVLETDLEFDGLDKVPLLSTGLLVGLQGRLG
jgi:hypothetical protein